MLRSAFRVCGDEFAYRYSNLMRYILKEYVYFLCLRDISQAFQSCSKFYDYNFLKQNKQSDFEPSSALSAGQNHEGPHHTRKL